MQPSKKAVPSGYSPRYLPRKGTETATVERLASSALRFATIFTPQGDGNCKKERDNKQAKWIRHDIYPARGRKPTHLV